MRYFSLKLWPSIFKAKFRMKRLAAARGVPTKFIRSFGAIGIDPQYLSVWIATDKDWERDQLQQDATFEAACRLALLRSGYPAGSVPLVGVTIQSQQTVDRNCHGNWYWAML